MVVLRVNLTVVIVLNQNNYTELFLYPIRYYCAKNYVPSQLDWHN